MTTAQIPSPRQQEQQSQHLAAALSAGLQAAHLMPSAMQLHSLTLHRLVLLLQQQQEQYWQQ